MSRPFLAALPVPSLGLGVALSRAIQDHLRGRDHRRWPDAGGPGLHVTAYAFADERDADEFVSLFREQGARRISP